MTWWNHKAFQSRDGVICDGSVRSGKTLSMTVGFFLWSMSSFQESRFALCGKTIETLRRNVIWEAPRWLEGVLQFQEKRSENRITVTGMGHQNEYYLFGGKDEGSYALIQGITLAGVLFDEVVLMPRSFVEQALARCSVEGSKYWFNCNPEGPEHWFYREWIQQWERKNLLYLHFTMADNPALAPSVRARYEATYTGVFYDRYVRGLWVAAEGLVYDFFDESMVVPPPEGAAERWICSGRRRTVWVGATSAVTTAPEILRCSCCGGSCGELTDGCARGNITGTAVGRCGKRLMGSMPMTC